MCGESDGVMSGEMTGSGATTGQWPVVGAAADNRYPLVFAATPIGHRADASLRLIECLAEADVIAAEDTRRAKQLVSALGVSTAASYVSLFEHNEIGRVPQMVEYARAGNKILVISDAGMPTVSDPGFALVGACIEHELSFTCLPGPSAVTTALVLSGAATDRFSFEGFAPRKTGQRATWLSELASERRTWMFFESPHRIAATLADAARVIGPERQAAVCRELTKTYEEVRRGPLSQLAAWASEGVKGEIVVVVSGDTSHAHVSLPELVATAQARVEDGERLKTVTRELAGGTSVSARDIYDAVLAQREQQ